MTEAGWLPHAFPGEILSWLRGKASARKLRLFACACVRRVGHLMPDRRGHRAIEVAECLAGPITSWVPGVPWPTSPAFNGFTCDSTTPVRAPPSPTEARPWRGSRRRSRWA
jgi:hypothetical protein